MPTAQACVVCECCVRGAPVLLGGHYDVRELLARQVERRKEAGEVDETVVMVGFYVVMCCDVRIDAGTKCWSSGKGDYHVGHVTGVDDNALL